MTRFASPMSLARVLMVAVIGLYGAQASATPILSISPASTPTTVGQNFSLNIDIAGAADLYGFQFDIAFNPSALQASDIVEGAFLPSGGSTFYIPGTIDNVAGTISFTADALIGAISGVAGNGTLATIDFTALAAGVSPISISNVLLLDSQFNTLDFTSNDGSVTVRAGTGPSAPVPEPASLILVGLGLAGIARRAIRRAARRSASEVVAA